MSLLFYPICSSYARYNERTVDFEYKESIFLISRRLYTFYIIRGIVRRRVINTIMLYSKQKRLVSMVADQMYESEKGNTLMVSILSHIVEFRNGESGLHVLHIGTMTELLLKRLREKTNAYNLDSAKISMISKAAAFHDIGKISISEEILNKPGRLTKEEFEVIKTHSAVGADMLANLPLHKEEPLVKIAYEICRWHHERYDGSGYPDGLEGEELPISAQVVSLADAYDALISERVYKKASMTSQIQFEYTAVPSMLTVSDWGAERLGLPRVFANPVDNKEFWEAL